LRAIAALGVVVSHVGAYSNSRGQDFTGRLIGGTQIGVTLFFLISGFLLYRPFLVARARGTHLSIRGYARRRFFRIGPPYWAILTGLALWPGLQGHVLGDEALKYYGFAQVYGQYHETGGLIVAWSLCTEVAFYAVLPVVAWALHRATRRLEKGPVTDLVLLALLAVGSAAFHSYSVGHPVAGWSGLPRTLPANFDWFALGMIVAVLSVGGGSVAILARRLVAKPLYAVAFASVAFVAMTARSEPNHVLQGIACFVVLGALVLGPSESRLNKFLSTRALTALGLVSYSIFLLHDPLARWLADAVSANFFALLGLTLLLTVPLAALTYQAVELPSMRLGRAGEAKRKAAAGHDEHGSLPNSAPAG
jgi:peptidoglycan/LPS O-acetylase OafA/YrhL